MKQTRTTDKVQVEISISDIEEIIKNNKNNFKICTDGNDIMLYVKIGKLSQFNENQFNNKRLDRAIINASISNKDNDLNQIYPGEDHSMDEVRYQYKTFKEHQENAALLNSLMSAFYDGEDEEKVNKDICKNNDYIKECLNQK